MSTFHQRLQEKIDLSNAAVKDSVVVKFMDDNHSIKMIQPIHDPDLETVLEIIFCENNRDVIAELVRNGITLSTGTNIKVKVNLSEITSKNTSGRSHLDDDFHEKIRNNPNFSRMFSQGDDR